MLQEMSESIASAWQYLDNDKMQQTRLFICMVDRFFDSLNVRNPLIAQVKQKDSIAPYKSQNDERFEVQHMHMQSIHDDDSPPNSVNMTAFSIAYYNSILSDTRINYDYLVFLIRLFLCPSCSLFQISWSSLWQINVHR